MSKIYRVTLQPLDWFFFGGETTLQNSTKDNNGKVKEKYIYYAHSNNIPQQTTLLGMLRYQLLKQNDLLHQKNDKVKKRLIGEESFSMRVDNQSFGIIQQLSPVFITDGKVNYFPMPLSSNYSHTEEVCKVGFNDTIKESFICFDNFNEKTYNNYLKWKGSNGEELYISDLFETTNKIGITKPRDNGEPDEEAFFKLEMCRFKNKTKDNIKKFCFYVEIDDSNKLNNDNVFIGAERSCFSMKAEEDKNIKTIWEAYLNSMGEAKPNPPKSSIILLSPTYISDIDKLNELLLFHWSYPMAFRNLEMVPSTSPNTTSTSTSVSMKKFNSGDVIYHRYNIKYNMLCAGSHLYFSPNKLDEIKKILDNINLQNIGYNYYL